MRNADPTWQVVAGERLLLASLAVICGAAAFLNYWSYNRGEPELSSSTLAILQGHADAPMQYRILMPWIAALLRDFMPELGWWEAFGRIDYAGLALACVGLWLAHRERMAVEAFAPGPRLAAGAILAGVLAFNLAWLDWYQKVATVPSLAYVIWAGMLLERTRHAQRRGWIPSAAFLLALTFAQALNRADVAAALGVGTAVAALGTGAPDAVRRRQVLLGLLMAAMAVLIQLWLAFVVYREAGYGAAPVVMLQRNVTGNLWPATLFLLPVLFTVLALLRQTRRLPPVGWAMLLYLPVWVTVAQISEVRILIPFAVALAPFTALAAVRGLGFAPERGPVTAD